MILGINSKHDSGAAIVDNGEVIAAADEERFKRKKHYSGFPDASIKYCLDKADVDLSDIEGVAIPWHSLSKVEQACFKHSDIKDISDKNLNKNLLEKGMNELRNDYIGFSRSLLRFIKKSFPSDDGSRLHIDIDGINYSEFNPDIYLVDHHEAHAANAYYCSGSGDTLVLTLDGAGSGKSGTLWLGQDGELDHIRSWDVSGSLGWFYGVVTEAFGWVMNNGEGKTMGLAAFTESDPSVETELKRICPEYEDGELVSGIDWEYTQSYRGNDIYSRYYQQVDHVKQLIERYGREDVAAATQSLLESQVMNIVEHWLSRLDVDQIASSGGIFLNVKLNSLIKNKTDVQSHFTFPNAGDGGLPVGAAFTGWKKERGSLSPFNFSDVYAGPDLVETTSYETIEDILDERGLLYTQEPNVERKVAELLHEGRTVAWCQGKMEYGPRALGNRSILANPTNNQNKDRVNNRVKFREAWRPFAPSILEEAADKYLIDPLDDPFMISSASVKEDKLDQIPAVVHVDGTSRPQIVKKDVNPRYWKLINEFENLSGVPVLLNTSYNLSGDPIVLSARDAIKTFYDSGLSFLALDDYILYKKNVDSVKKILFE